MYVGQFTIKVGPAYRLCIPAKFLIELRAEYTDDGIVNGKCPIVIYAENYNDAEFPLTDNRPFHCLRLYNQHVWSEKVRDFEDYLYSNGMDQLSVEDELRNLIKHTMTASADDSGRITVSKDFAESAGLEVGSEADLISMRDTVEVWSCMARTQMPNRPVAAGFRH